MKSPKILFGFALLASSVALWAQDKNKTPNTNPEEALAERLIKIQTAAAKQQVDEIRDKTEKEAARVGEAGMFTVSAELRTLPNITPAVIKMIDQHKQAIRLIFRETARQIEAGHNAKLTFSADSGLQLSRHQAESAERLRNAVEENSISLRSLGLAVNAYISISDEMYRAAVAEANPEKKYNLYVQYTTLVYELSDIVIGVLSDFEVSGVGEIRKIYDERVAAVDRIKTEITSQREAQRKGAKEHGLTDEALKKEMKKYDDWTAALDNSMARWGDILSIIDKQKDWAKSAERNISRLQLVRKDAQLQLNILREVGIVKQTLNYLNGLEDILRINDLPLLRLDAPVVNELLGLSSPEKVPPSKL